MCAGVPTLKTSHDFRRIAQTGQKWVTPAFILQISKDETRTGFRLGLTRGASLGQGLGGGAEVNTTRRGTDKTIFQLTIVTAVVFALSLILGVLG